MVGVERDVTVFVGHYTVATDADGRFLFANLPARTDYILHGLMKSFGERGAIRDQRVFRLFH